MSPQGKRFFLMVVTPIYSTGTQQANAETAKTVEHQSRLQANLSWMCRNTRGYNSMKGYAE